MWPFKKKAALKHPYAGFQGEGLRHGEGFGFFSPLFEDGLGYLPLLNLGPDSQPALALVRKCCASVSNPHQDIRRLFGQANWRPHLVGAVAVAALAHNTETTRELWGAIDRGSWVTPQLAAAAFLRDPMFVDHAWERLRSGCPLDTSEYARFSGPERHIATGPAGTVERSAKMAASLARLSELLPHAPDWLTTQAASDLTSLLRRDVDSSGQIAERWLIGLKRI